MIAMRPLWPLLLAGVLFAPQRVAGSDTLRLGVVPYLTASRIVETYQPIADALEKQLQRRVVLYTARDIPTFVERRRMGDYDILLTAPHLAWLATHETGYRPLLQYEAPMHGIVVVRAESSIAAVSGLRGHRIALASPFSLAVLVAQTELSRQGLRPGLDYQTADAFTHVNAALQVLRGSADAAILAHQPYLRLAAAQREQLRVVSQTRALPGPLYLTHPRLGDDEVAAIGRALARAMQLPSIIARVPRGYPGELGAPDSRSLEASRRFAIQVRERLRRP